MIRIVMAILLLAPLQEQEKKKKFWFSFQGKSPPELAADKEHLLNADQAPSLGKPKSRITILAFTSVM